MTPKTEHEKPLTLHQMQSKGGKHTFEKYGREHFQKLSKKRWKGHKAEVKAKKIAEAKKLLGIKD